MTQLQKTELFTKALGIKKTLGTRRAAGFLRNRGISCEEAVLVLARAAR